MGDKIRYGLSNVYIAIWNSSLKDYCKPKAIKGAVSIDLEPIEDQFAVTMPNGIKQTLSQSNKGYNGTIKFEYVPVWFNTDILGDILDSNKVLIESSTCRSISFALLFQFETDLSGRRLVLYNCKCNRQKINGESISKSIKTQKDEFKLEIRPRIYDKKIKSCTTSETPLNVYNNWFNTVY
jgi:phi13 family phage major tail protein